jgi:pimeloyl-ACP methyl ester carboxylesterase
MGSSDLTVPPAGVVPACARAIGPDRQFFTTEDTVADLDALRRALGVDKLTIDGVSYGTFVAARYAVIHPARVSRLVLDSVVPHDNLDPLELASLGRTAEVLRMVCQETGCPTDPVQDLSTVVQARHDGPELLDTLTALTIGTPKLADVPAALRRGAWQLLGVGRHRGCRAPGPGSDGRGTQPGAACQHVVRGPARAVG